MTETEWLETEDLQQMLWLIRRPPYGPIPAQKYHHFVVACLQNVEHLIEDEALKNALLAIERCADDLATPQEIEEATVGIEEARARISFEVDQIEEQERSLALAMVADAIAEAMDSFSNETIRRRLDLGLDVYPYLRNIADNTANACIFAALSDEDDLAFTQRAKQCDHLREIVGNPWWHFQIQPEWLTHNEETVPKLAQVLYHEKRFDEMPILSDALQDAGCTNQRLLDHCHQERHVRGCWLLDLLRAPRE